MELQLLDNLIILSTPNLLNLLELASTMDF